MRRNALGLGIRSSTIASIPLSGHGSNIDPGDNLTLSGPATGTGKEGGPDEYAGWSGESVFIAQAVDGRLAGEIPPP